MNLRDRILNVRDLKEREVIVPEWATEESPDGAKVLVRGLTAEERYTMLTANTGTPATYGRNAVGALIGCVLDPETRKPVFEPADRDFLYRKSGAVIDRLIGVMNQLSGISPNPVEDAEKN